MTGRFRCAVVLMVMPGTLLAGTVGALKAYDEQGLRSPGDWLLSPTATTSGVYRTADSKALVLANGLIARTFRLGPNLATVSLKRLDDGSEYLRSVRPEAIVELDGVRYEVGGLAGQPVHNYLDARWLDRMTAKPEAYRFVSFRVGPTEARFPWRKRLEWMPRDLPWPAPGVRLTLTFGPPVAAPDPDAGALLWSEDFSAPLASSWVTHVTPTHPRASFSNEGKAGELLAPSDSCVYAERAVPAGAAVFEVTVDAGDDVRANSWGPGLALRAGGKTVCSLVMRPHSQHYEICTPDAGERLVGRFDRERASRLRVTLEAGQAIFEAAQEGVPFQRLGVLAVSGMPDRLRVGKVGKAGAGKDYSDAKADPALMPPRCHVRAVAVRQAPPAVTAASARADLPEVDVHYELYDGLPALCKWVSLRNGTARAARLNTFVCETLAVVEPESVVDDAAEWGQPELCVETDYSFCGMSAAGTRQAAVHWVADPLYDTQVNYARKTPCLVECRPPRGPDQLIPAGGTFETFRTFVLAYDSDSRERRNLAYRRFYRTLAPWVTENPILMHVRSADAAAVRLAIDQCADVGFEMVVMTFGSGFNFESRDPAYQAGVKELADYGRGKQVALGGYSLLASRGAAKAADNTQGVPARFGVMPCLGSQWGLDYLTQLRGFIEAAGLGVLEHDGSYPGDLCAATNHPYHRGLDDSQWVMWKAITELYQGCRGQGVYLNIPDWYFLNGGNKTGMGYRETNWSLPREYQEIIERQNVFDGTRAKTPSMGWMFVPLTQYHGGGAAATIEPLDAHRAHYGQRLANLFGAGVQACYRGPRLYDTEATRALVKGWVGFYKRHRAVLDADIIHLRRADGRDIDSLLHVDPGQKTCGMLAVYNPLDVRVMRRLSVPLYYTGLTDRAVVTPLARVAAGEAPSEAPAGPSSEAALDREWRAVVAVDLPPHGTGFWAIERP